MDFLFIHISPVTVTDFSISHKQNQFQLHVSGISTLYTSIVLCNNITTLNNEPRTNLWLQWKNWPFYWEGICLTMLISSEGAVYLHDFNPRHFITTWSPLTFSIEYWMEYPDCKLDLLCSTTINFLYSCLTDDSPSPGQDRKYFGSQFLDCDIVSHCLLKLGQEFSFNGNFGW